MLCNPHYNPSPGVFIIPPQILYPGSTDSPPPVPSPAACGHLCSTSSSMDLSAANTLGDQQGQRCIQIWELLYQIISRVPLGGGGLNCSVICNYLGQAPLSLGFPRQGYWIFPTQGLNSCLLHWRVGYQLSHQGSKFYPTGKGPYRVNCSRVWPHVHPEACMCCQPHLTLVVALPVHIH